jgi:ActR/RegA family two-component response regulator
MLATTTSREPQLIPVPAPKPRLLLVSDSAECLQALKSCVNTADFEINFARSLKELPGACRESHDLVALDAGPSQIVKMLNLIRGSAGHAEIPVLVEYTRISNDLSLAGVLPYYRAMPCNRVELHTLLRKYNETTNQIQSRRVML